MYSSGEVKEEEREEGENSVTIDDIKNVTPFEEEAETSILKAVDKSDITVDPPLETISIKHSLLLNKSCGKGNIAMKDAAIRIRNMHRVAQAVRVSESKGEEEQQQPLLREKTQPDIVPGAMGDTTNAMVANANVLLQRKSGKSTEGDIENGKENEDSKRSDGSNSNKPSSWLPVHIDMAQAKVEMNLFYKGLKPEVSRIMKMFRATVIFGVLLFIAAVITYYAIDPHDVCISAEAYKPPTSAPTSAPLVSNVTVPVPSATPAPTTTPAPVRTILFEDCTTISWLCLFVIRQIITFYLALFAQLIIIDVLCLQCRWVTKFLSRLILLGLTQSKGWPFISFMWSIINFLMASGNSPFAKHWFFWVGWGLFSNEKNPAGNITNSVIYRDLLFTMLVLGIVASAKRLWFGVMFGKRTYRNFHEQLTNVMGDVVMISEVAHLSKLIEMNLIKGGLKEDDIMNCAVMDWGKKFASVISIQELSFTSLSEEDGDVVLEKEDLTVSQRDNINRLVGEWDEPKLQSNDSTEECTLEDIIHFSQTLAFINNNFPFTTSFGPAWTREACIQSAQNVFKRLQKHSGSTGNIIPFETIAIVTCRDGNNIDEEQAKRLLRTFRPDREGNLTLLDFAKSVDNVYKKLRLMQASIKNSSQIDNAAERIYNVAFYLAYFFIVQAALFKITIFSTILFLFFSIIAPLGFALSSACGKYVEGVLLVLVRKPYGIGDRIALSDVAKDTSKTGSATWFVENVDLFTTTVRFSITNEVATLANSSLAPCRIINANRSPKAAIRVTLRFGVDVEMTKVDKFYFKVEEYVKERPREFFQMNGLFASSIAVEKGYVEYILSVQHHESWQNMGSVWKSKVELTQYCHNLSKELEMKFTNPVLPVEIVKITEKGNNSSDQSDSQSVGENPAITTGVPSIETVDEGNSRT